MTPRDAAGPHSWEAARAGVARTPRATGVPILSQNRSGGVTRHPRPDLFDTYPDPRLNFRPSMYGLTLDQYRAEWCRRQAAGWLPWELAARFPRPEQVAA